MLSDSLKDELAFLNDFLKDGAREANAVFQRGVAVGDFKKYKLRRAAKELGIKPEQVCRKWYWSLPGVPGKSKGLGFYGRFK